MTWKDELIELRDALANLYPLMEDGIRIAEETGLDKKRIEFQRGALNNWHAILAEAMQRDLVGKLITVVHRWEFKRGANPAFDAAAEAYLAKEQLLREHRQNEPQALSGSLGAVPSAPATVDAPIPMRPERWTDELKALRKALAELYDDPDAIRVVADDAGIDPENIKLVGGAGVVWHSILSEAHKQGRVTKLVEVVLESYPGNEQLIVAAHAYQERCVSRFIIAAESHTSGTAAYAPVPHEEQAGLRLSQFFRSTTIHYGQVDSSLSFMKPSVDRERERELLAEMIQGQRQENVLLIQAPGGMGKSTLVREFWDLCDRHPRALIDLKNSTYSAAEILGDFSAQLSSIRFERFFMRRDEFATMSYERLGLGLQTLTDAFFEDLSRAYAYGMAPIVLLIDTHDKASQDVKNWLASQFLLRVGRYHRLITVVAGRDTPQIDSRLLKSCLRHELDRLHVEHIREYVRLMDLDMSEDSIRFLREFTDGVPLMLEQGVDNMKKHKEKEAADHG